MGCWNGTCFVTNLSIGASEPVVGFIIKNGVSTGGCCYSSGHGSPVSMPIFGQYNDYGSIENIEENWATNHTVNQFKEYLTNKKFEVKYDDYYYKEGDDLNIEQVVTLVERGLSIKQMDGFRVGLGFERQEFDLVMMLRSVWDRITSEDGMDGWNDFLEAAGEQTDAKEKLKRYSNHPLTKKPAEECDEGELQLKLYIEGIIKQGISAVMRDELSLPRNNKFGNMSRNYTDTFGNGIQWFRDYTKEMTEEDAKMLLRYSSLFYKLEDMRKTWSGQSGKGSQYENYQEMLDLANIIKEHACEKLKEREEW